MITIDGVDYQIPIISLDIQNDLLVKSGAERTQDGVLRAQPIGHYRNFDVEFASSSDNPAQYAALFRVLSSGFLRTVTIYDEQGALLTQQGYFSGVKHSMYRIKNGMPYFKGLRASFVADRPTNR